MQLVAEPEKRNGRLLQFLMRGLRTKLIPLVFFGAVGVCLVGQILGREGNNLIFLPSCSN